MDGTVTRHVYDGEGIVLEFDGANALQARTTHGPGIDDPVVVERDLDASGGFGAGSRRSGGEGPGAARTSNEFRQKSET